MATLNTIRDLMRAQPFRPFDLILGDGTRYAVPHPDYLSIPPVRRPREIEYYLVINDGDDYEYRTRWLDLNLILEVAAPCDDTFRRSHPRPPGPSPQPSPEERPTSE